MGSKQPIASLWSTSVLSIEPESESDKAWSHFFRGEQVFKTESSASGKIFCVSHSWTVYSVSLGSLAASRVKRRSAKPVGDASRCSSLVLCENDKFLVLLSNDNRELYRFELARGEWTTVYLAGPCPPKRRWAALAACSSELYLFNGLATMDMLFNDRVNELWRIDVRPDRPAQWALVQNNHPGSPRRRSSHRFVSDGKRMFLYGGRIKGYVAEYDPETNAWTEISRTGWEGKVPHHAFLVDGNIFSLCDDTAGLTPLKVLNVSHRSGVWLGLGHPVPWRYKTSRYSPGKYFTSSFTSRIYVFERNYHRDTAIVHILDTRLIIDPKSSHPILAADASPSSLHLRTLSFVRSCIATRNFDLIKISDTLAAKGGFCDVFIGVHAPTGMKLALKRPQTPVHNAEDTLRRILREVDFWSTFDHPHVLPFLGVVEVETHTYLTSPWLDQGDLASFASERAQHFKDGAKRGRLRSPKHVLYDSYNEVEVIQGIAAGISYLHSLRFVHGDLKGKNILLGPANRPLLCDFGVTKAFSSVTSSNMKGTGTLRWESIELFAGESKTYKSDVYALAMVITEVLTGSHPLPALNDLAFLVQVVCKDRRPSFEPLSRNGIGFRRVWRIAADCWVKEPEARPSIEDVLDRLKAIPIRNG